MNAQLQSILDRLTTFYAQFQNGESLDFAPIVEEVTQALARFEGRTLTDDEKSYLEKISIQVGLLSTCATQEMGRLKQEMTAEVNLAKGLRAYAGRAQE